MAGKTITTPKKTNGVFTIDEINALFTEIATVLNAKLDLDGAVVSTENFDCGTKQVINVADAVDDNDAVPLRQLQELT